MERIVHIIIPVEIERAGQRIEIEKAIPNNIIRLDGISFSVPTYIKDYQNNRMLSLASVDINNRTVYPFSGSSIDYYANMLDRKQPVDGYFRLNEAVTQSSRIFVRCYDQRKAYTDDSVKTFQPYTVNCYLRAVRMINECKIHKK